MCRIPAGPDLAHYPGHSFLSYLKGLGLYISEESGQDPEYVLAGTYKVGQARNGRHQGQGSSPVMPMVPRAHHSEGPNLGSGCDPMQALGKL